MSTRVLTALTALALLTGCSGTATSTATSTAPATSSATHAEHGAGAPTSTAPAGATVAAALAHHGLTGAPVEKVVDTLDRTNDDRSSGLGGSVRMDRLVLTVGDEEQSMPMPADRTYLSVAPYVTRTHDCFAHHLSGCQGEQVDTPVDVRITDATGKVLVAERTRTYANGFVGYWLPRGLTGTITMTIDGRTGSVPFGTGPQDPTCLTTLRLA